MNELALIIIGILAILNPILVGISFYVGFKMAKGDPIIPKKMKFKIMTDEERARLELEKAKIRR